MITLKVKKGARLYLYLYVRYHVFCGGFGDFSCNFSAWKAIFIDDPETPVKKRVKEFYYFLNYWNLRDRQALWGYDEQFTEG
jgi:hypothetical protein